jgi:hypothetical protein
MKRAARRLLKIVGALLLVAALAALVAVLTLRSAWFHEKVRQRIVSELERVTGGEATLGVPDSPNSRCAERSRRTRPHCSAPNRCTSV